MPNITARSYQCEGTLLPVDSTTYVSFPFDVAEGCQSIRLRLAYAPYRAGKLHSLITLGLFDPKGFRGQAHRGPPDAEVTVSTGAATPGFVAGPLPAGRWQAEMAVHSVVPTAEPCTYTLDIAVSSSSAASNPTTSILDVPGFGLETRPIQRDSRQPGWYRGELHSHTVHSDGACTVAELLAHARQRKLDFIAITDHNTVSTWADVHELPPDSPLVIPSLELTTFYGHAVALGVNRWIDWRTGHDGWTINDAARATHDAGGLFIIAHPSSPGSPVCTGCRWDYIDMDMSLVDGMEVWTGLWDKQEDNNPRNLKLWRDQTGMQRNIVAVAAADFHGPVNWSDHIPATYVYAEELSVQGILQGIEQGRVMMTTGPWLEMKKTSKKGVLLDERVRDGPEQMNLLATWRDAPPGARLRWLAGNSQLGEMAISEQGTAGLFASSGRVHLELWSGDGILLAMTNPTEIVP